MLPLCRARNNIWHTLTCILFQEWGLEWGWGWWTKRISGVCRCVHDNNCCFFFYTTYYTHTHTPTYTHTQTHTRVICSLSRTLWEMHSGGKLLSGQDNTRTDTHTHTHTHSTEKRLSPIYLELWYSWMNWSGASNTHTHTRAYTDTHTHWLT